MVPANRRYPPGPHRIRLIIPKTVSLARISVIFYKGRFFAPFGKFAASRNALYGLDNKKGLEQTA
jgi:hypothetical protein